MRIVDIALFSALALACLPFQASAWTTSPTKPYSKSKHTAHAHRAVQTDGAQEKGLPRSTLPAVKAKNGSGVELKRLENQSMRPTRSKSTGKSRASGVALHPGRSESSRNRSAIKFSYHPPPGSRARGSTSSSRSRKR